VYARLQLTVPEGPARRLPGGQLAQPIPGAAPAAPARQPLPAVLEPLQRQGFLPVS
jgi:hypothetical protein